MKRPTVKRSRVAETAVPTPSRDDILAFVARESEASGERGTTKIGKREIARAFGLKGTDKIGLKQVLKEMEADGVIERKRKSLMRPGVLPPTLNLDAPSRDSGVDRVAHTAQERRIDVALSNSFGFGGTNASLVVRRA